MKTTQFTIWLRTAMLAVGLLLGQLSWAQPPIESATFAFSYKFQSDEGTNASAVTYIPQLKLYVTCIAGNADYPIEVFDASGKTITSISCGMDLRGLWYNPKTNRLEANGYGDLGWFSMPIGGNGVPTGEWTTIRTGQHQPNEQSVLSYIPSIQKLVTLNLDNNSFSFLSRKSGKLKVRYHHGTPGDTEWYFNPYCAAYTGNDEYPIALLELNAGQIIYFDLKGKYLNATTISEGLPEMDGFRFAFANRHAFIYDETSRTWTAYRVF
jgi:hypothetical protein